MKFILCGLTFIVITSAIECKDVACWPYKNKSKFDLDKPPTSADCSVDIACDAEIDAELQLENLNFGEIDRRANEVLESYKNISMLWKWSCGTEKVEVAVVVNAIGINLTKLNLPTDSNLVHEVNVSHNDLTAIKDHSFGNIESLWTLDLSHNRIEHIAEKALVNIKGIPIKIEYLVLNNNNLSTVDNICLSLEKKCIYLDVSYNRIESLNWLEKDTYNSLKDFNANFNRITSVGSHFRSMPDLRELSLQGNSIKFISHSALFLQGALLSLDLSSNNIHTLQPEMFYGLDSLLSLNLSHNKIDGITEEYFKESHDLKVLDLSDNNLGQFTLSMGREFAPLDYLLLEDNNLTEDEVSEVLKFPLKVHKIRVGGNNFNCRNFIYKQARQMVHKNVKAHPEERNEDIQIYCTTGDREEMFGVNPENETTLHNSHYVPLHVNVWQEFNSWSHPALVDVRIRLSKPIHVSDTKAIRERNSNSGSIGTVVCVTSAIAFVVISVVIGYIMWRHYPNRIYSWSILRNSS